MPKHLTRKTLALHHVLALAGAALLYAGLFAPVLHVPFFGELSYLHFGQVEAFIVLLLTGAATLLTAFNLTHWTWGPSVGSTACIAFTAFSLWRTAVQTHAEIQTNFAISPLRQLAQVTLDSVEIKWGWVVLVTGAILSLVGAGIAHVRLRVEHPGATGS